MVGANLYWTGEKKCIAIVDPINTAMITPTVKIIYSTGYKKLISSRYKDARYIVEKENHIVRFIISIVRDISKIVFLWSICVLSVYVTYGDLT